MDPLRFKASDRGLAKHLEKHPEANREFVRQALLETIADLELDSES